MSRSHLKACGPSPPPGVVLVQGDGLTTGFNTASPSSNVVTIAGLPCAVDSASLTLTSLTCTPANAYGKVYAE